MKLELYKPYKTRGGWKAVVINYSGDYCLLAHIRPGEESHTRVHEYNGSDLGVFVPGATANEQYDIIGEWEEPLEQVVYAGVYKHKGKLYIDEHEPSRTLADDGRSAGRVACQRIVLREGQFDE